MSDHNLVTKSWSGMLTVIGRAAILCVVMMLVTAVFMSALSALLNRRDAAPEIVLTPGIFLPTAVWLRPNIVKFGDRTLIGDGETRFICSRYSGQRVSYKLVDSAGVNAAQERRFTINGINQALRSILRPEQEGSRLLYVKTQHGFGTALVQYWFHDFHNMLKSPVIAGAVVYPMMIIFVFSVIASRKVLETNVADGFVCAEATLIFLIYLSVLILAGSYFTDHAEKPLEMLFDRENIKVTVVKSEVSISWQRVLLLDVVLPVVVIGCGIRLWRRPFSNCIARIGTFATTGVVMNLSLNALAGLVLLMSGTADFHSHFVAIKEYAVPLQVIGMEISMGHKPDLTDSPVRHLANWDEACPAWSRFELRVTDPQDGDLHSR